MLNFNLFSQLKINLIDALKRDLISKGWHMHEPIHIDKGWLTLASLPGETLWVNESLQQFYVVST